MSCATCRNLAARQSIIDLLHRYCRAVDDRDAEAFQQLWTPNARVDFGTRYRGPAAGLLDWMAATHAATLSMSHHVANPLVELEQGGSDARSSCDVSALVVTRLDGRPKGRLVRGRYEDVVVLHGGEWRIASRRFEPRHEVMLSPPAEAP